MYFSKILTIFPKKLHFRKGFCQKSIFVSVAVFCFPCGLETLNLSFFRYLDFPTSYDNKCSNIFEAIHENYHILLNSYGSHIIMLLYCHIIMLLCSFFVIFTPYMNKYCKNALRFQRHVTKQNKFCLHTLKTI